METLSASLKSMLSSALGWGWWVELGARMLGGRLLRRPKTPFGNSDSWEYIAVSSLNWWSPKWTFERPFPGGRVKLVPGGNPPPPDDFIVDPGGSFVMV